MRILAVPPPPGTQHVGEQRTPELDSLVGVFMGPDPDGGFDRELDDDPRAVRGRRADASADPDETAREPGGRQRLATGTGQFDLRTGDMNQAAAEVPIERIMTRKVVCARTDMDALRAHERMIERDVTGLPVVDDWGRAVGLISRGDLIEHGVLGVCGAEQTAAAKKTVSDVMMPFVFALTPDATVGRAAALMAYEGIRRIVVVDQAGYVVGLVSSVDVSRWLAWSAGYTVGRDP